MDSFIRDRWVSVKFRELVKTTCNLTDEKSKIMQGHWNFMQYIMLHPRIFHYKELEVPDQIAIPQTFMRILYQDSRHLLDFSEIIAEFENLTGITLNLTHYNWQHNLCRSVSPVFPEELQKALDLELQKVSRDHKDEVLFTTGESYNMGLVMKKRKIHRDKIMAVALSEDHPSHSLVNYLHSKKILRATAELLLPNLELLADEIDACLHQETKRLLIDVYDNLVVCPYIRYGAVDKSCRIYAQKTNILQIPSEVRNKLFSGEHVFDIDLKYSQFHIIAELWDVPKAKKFIISSKKSIWQALCEYAGLDINTVSKRALKKFLYGIFYGMVESNLSNHLMQNFGNDRMLKHPIVKQLLKCRELQRRKIEESCGAMDAFSKWIPLETAPGSDSYYSEVSSILAQVAQSHELKIILSVFSEIKQNNNLKMLAFMHDGFILRVVDNAIYTESYLQRIRKVLRESTSWMFTPMTLDIKPLEPQELSQKLPQKNNSDILCNMLVQQEFAVV